MSEKQEQQNTERSRMLGTMEMRKLVPTVSVPIMVSMLVQALYNIVDGIFVGQYSPDALTAVNLAMPMQMLMIAVSTGMGTGINSLISRRLGEKRPHEARDAARHGILIEFVGWLLFVIVGLFFARAYIGMTKPSAEVLEMGTQYLQIVCTLSLGQFLSICFERMMQATGNTKLSMITQLSGAVTNIVLDPILIFLCHMGIAGAAVATVIGQCVAAVLGIYMNIQHNPDVQLGFKYMKPNWKIISPILTVGIPSVIMNGIGSVMNFGMNQILQGFHETATGVFGIYFKLQSLFFMPLFGINNATISIIAYNYGARKPKRIVHTLKLATAVAVCIMLVGLTIFQLFPDKLLDLFNPTEDFMAIGVRALRILCLPFPVAAVCIALSASFQALGNGIYSTIVSLCRQMLVLLPVAYLLSLTGDVNAVWWSFPVAEVASALVTALLFARLYRQKVKPLFSVVQE